jgi:hypothetical protein
VAEQILPETDTPGARSARVHEFVDRMLAEYYPAADRERFVAGLARLDARARRRHGRGFADCAPEEQYALVDALDRQAFPPRRGGRADQAAGGGARAGAAAQRDPVTRNANERAGQAHAGRAPVGRRGLGGRGRRPPRPRDAGPEGVLPHR